MARMRELKPSFFMNDVLASLPPLARLLFQGLWCHADRDGRLLDRPIRLKEEILPYDPCDVDEFLDLLGNTKDHDGEPFILRYQVGGVRYIQVVKFALHQSPHIKEKPSSIPAPNMHGASTGEESLCSGDLSLESGDLRVESGKGPGRSAPPAPPTLDAVIAYATASGAPEAAQAFFDYWTSIGWHKRGQPIRDYQAEFRIWLTRERRFAEERAENGHHARPKETDAEKAERLKREYDREKKRRGSS